MMVQSSLHENSQLKLEGTLGRAQRGSFDKLVLAAIDAAFSSISESAKHIIYFHLKECHNISVREIPSRIDDFADALEESFGKDGKLIEIQIMKAFYEKAGRFLYFPHEENLSFSSYLETLRYFV